MEACVTGKLRINSRSLASTARAAIILMLARGTSPAPAGIVISEFWSSGAKRSTSVKVNLVAELGEDLQMFLGFNPFQAESVII